MKMPSLKSNHIIILSIIYNVCQKYETKKAPKAEIMAHIENLDENIRHLFDLNLEESGFDYIFSGLFVKKLGFLARESMNTEGKTAKNQALYSITEKGELFLKKYYQFLSDTLS